jgi:predicted MFS family arabinose efflux permease
MVALGPLLGGWLTTSFSWRWAFGINIPLAAVIITGVLLCVRESRDEHAGRVDAVGALLSVVASGSLVFALIEGRTYGWWLVDEAHRPHVGDWVWPWALSPIPFAFLLAILAGVAFVWWGRARERAGRASLLSFALLRIPSFRNGNFAAMIVSLGEFGIILALPLWLQNVIGYSALQTGFVLLALALGSFAASGVSGAFGQRFAPITLVRAGIAAEIIGITGLGFMVSAEATWAAIVPFLFVYGIGVGLATAQLTGVVLADVPVERSGQGSGTASTARQIGSALGIAILGTVLFTVAGASLAHRLTAQEHPLPDAVQSQIVDTVVTSAGGAIPALHAQDAAVGDAARAAFSDGTRAAAFVAAGALTAGLLATLRLSPAGAAGERRRRADGQRAPEGDDPVPAIGAGEGVERR